MYRFPRTRFVDQNSLAQQIDHIGGEVDEAILAHISGEGLQRVAEELVDVIHSAETALRIIQEKGGVSVTDIPLQVSSKNHLRDYYS